MSDRQAMQEVLRLVGLRKAYNVDTPTENEVLHGLDLRLQRNDFAALVGASGSGKSTLLNLIGLLDKPTGGELYLLEEPTRTMDDTHRTARHPDRFRIPVPSSYSGLHGAGKCIDAAHADHWQTHLATA